MVLESFWLFFGSMNNKHQQLFGERSMPRLIFLETLGSQLLLAFGLRVLEFVSFARGREGAKEMGVESGAIQSPNLLLKRSFGCGSKPHLKTFS